ncbi:MAG: hypothetical protein L6422_09980 [Candidatus Marinimicrobia bacterium]|nr:hypothetical protein [Candidatus Neomarinimicrobiota bacterium]
MNKKYLMPFVIVPFIANLAFTQNGINRADSPDAEIPEGMALNQQEAMSPTDSGCTICVGM